MNESGPPAARHDAAGDATTSRPIEVYPGTPRWVKLVGIITLLAVLLVGIMHLSGAAAGGHTTPAQHGVQQP